MMPVNPSSSRKGSSAAQKLDLFGSFLDGPATDSDLPKFILDTASRVAEGVPYTELIRQVRKAGHSVGDFITAFNSLEGAELVERKKVRNVEDRLVLLTSAGKAAIELA